MPRIVEILKIAKICREMLRANVDVGIVDPAILEIRGCHPRSDVFCQGGFPGKVLEPHPED